MSRHLFIQKQSKTNPLRFYVYAYLRSKDSINGKLGTPYYIGKGCGIRAWRKHKYTNVPQNKNNVVLLETFLSEIGALALERRYIEWYGRKDINTGILINKTAGGEGVVGMMRSIESRKLQSDLSSGELNSFYGKKHSAASIEQISLSRLGENNPMYGKTGKNSPHFGKIASDATKLKQSEAHKGENHYSFGKQQPILVCPHCFKQGGKNLMSRWHFDNCKFKTNTN